MTAKRSEPCCICRLVLSRKLQGSQNSNLNATRISHETGLDDPLLVWRILVWHIFGPPK